MTAGRRDLEYGHGVGSEPVISEEMLIHLFEEGGGLKAIDCFIN